MNEFIKMKNFEIVDWKQSLKSMIEKFTKKNMALQIKKL